MYAKLQKHLVPRFSILDPIPAGFPYDPYHWARCKHAHFSLRGCWFPAQHSGPHKNPCFGATAVWEDEDGYYIYQRSDWLSLLANFMGSNGKYRLEDPPLN